MKKIASVLLLMLMALTSANITNAAEEEEGSIDDIFNVDIVNEDLSDPEPEPIAEPEPIVESDPVVINSKLNVTADNEKGTGMITLNLNDEREVDKGKFTIKVPSVISINTMDIETGTVFDSINIDETTLNGDTLTVSLYSVNPVLAKWKAFSVPFTINKDTTQSDYVFALEKENTLLTDTALNELTTEANTSIELFTFIEPEKTEKEEWILGVSFMMLFAVMSLFAITNRRKNI